MLKSANPSLGELKRETEQTRAGLVNTVEQLRTTVTDAASDMRQRFSPESIKSEVTDYVRSRGDRLVEDVTAAARRNPMQAVAIGAGIAYPLLRLARAIPTPVLLIGAGLFLTGSKSGQKAVQKVSDIASDLTDEARRRSHDISDQVGAAAASARDAAFDAVDRAGEVMSTSADQFRTSAGSVASALHVQADDAGQGPAALAVSISAKGQALKASMVGLADTTAERVKSVVSDGASAFQGGMASTRDTLSETAIDLRNKAIDASDRAGKTIFQTFEQNPLLVAGVGLVLGGLLASALPRSELEDNLVGEASEAAKNRTRDVVSQSFDSTKDTAGEILKSVAQQAGAEGLTPDGIDATAKNIGLRVRRVAEAAISTAFEPESEPASSDAAGEHHGR